MNIKKFELKNYSCISWFDYYNKIIGESEEEIEKDYCYNKDDLMTLKNTFASYHCEIYFNGEKVANMGYYNFDGMGAWANLEITNITSVDLISVLQILKFDNDCECQEHEKGEKYSLFNLEYIDNSNPKDIFKNWVYQFNNLLK